MGLSPVLQLHSNPNSRKFYHRPQSRLVIMVAPMKKLRRSHTLTYRIVFALGAASVAANDAPLSFNRDIRPILSNHCFACHGPDASHRQAKLRLDRRDDAVGKQAIVPGKPEASELWKRIHASAAGDVMPPPAANKPLSTEQKAKLERWIKEGARYDLHWSYVPLTRPALPAVRDAAWEKTPVDAFVLSELEAKGLVPSPAADRRRLLRRLSLDLTGLPPGVDEVNAFAASAGDEDYEREVDRRLESPHFGERLAILWLDLVRFSDTVGYHGDQGQRIYPYRDYVIDAFNNNLPFDRFTIEQLAGDLLPEPTSAQRVATGFNRLNMMTREGGAQPKEYLAKYASDRVRTVSIAWLGSTMGCAECHDHKYDPFTTRDFYSLAAFFADVKQWGVYQDYNYTPNPDLKGWSNDHPFPPELEVSSPYLVRRRAALAERLTDLAVAARVAGASTGTAKPDREWPRKMHEFLRHHPDGWIEAKASAEADDTRRFVLEPGSRTLASIRVEAVPAPAQGGRVTRGNAGSASFRVKVSLRRTGTDKEEATKLFFGDADFRSPSYFNGDEVIGLGDRWRTDPDHFTIKQTAIWLLEQPVSLDAGDQLVVSLQCENAGLIRVSASPFCFPQLRDSRLPVELREALDEHEAGSLSAPQSRALEAAQLLATAWNATAFAAAKRLLREMFECGSGHTMTMVTEAAPPMETRVLPRGNWQDESGPRVEPAVPAFLPRASQIADRRLTRYDLARWLVAPENPLTARVFVNRLWKLFFGTGLSASVDDFGAQGEAPSHPELLDWLASEFIASKWNVKHMVRLIVTSAAYRQDSSLRPELRARDPQNRWLASQNPRRLEAELVRDNALAIAGLLSLELGGPSARPYQPAGYYANLQFPDREYEPHTGDRQYRRGVYTHWQRTFLHPMLASFDAPTREECMAARVVSNTPQQALTLLNDPSFVEAARAFAAELIAFSGDDAVRIDHAFRRALARSAKPRESESLLALLKRQRSEIAGLPGEAEKLLVVGAAPAPAAVAPIELAAWTQIARVILNLHETITRY